MNELITEAMRLAPKYVPKAKGEGWTRKNLMMRDEAIMSLKYMSMITHMQNSEVVSDAVSLATTLAKDHEIGGLIVRSYPEYAQLLRRVDNDEEE